MKRTKILLTLLAGISISGAAWASKPGTTTVPLDTVKFVNENMMTDTLAKGTQKDRHGRSWRVLRGERFERIERREHSERLKKHRRSERFERWERASKRS